LIKLENIANISASILAEFIYEFNKLAIDESITHGILSSVITDNQEIIDYLNSVTKLLILSDRTPLPIVLDYDTPETLGRDRIALAAGAAEIDPVSNILIIDAGTCITYDILSDGHKYLGGGISPGIEMRFKSLHTFTSKLPLVSRDKNFTLVGNSTKSSIRSGVQNGIIAEIEGIILKYKEEFPQLKVFFTGGDANYFVKKLKSNIFAIPNLVLLGLKDILKYNVEN